MPDVSGDTSECVAAIITILRSEFQVNAIYDRSAGRPNVTFTVSGEQYRVYIADRFEEQYTAAPQTGLSSNFAFWHYSVAQFVHFLMRYSRRSF
jgi:hypothetical protein